MDIQKSMVRHPQRVGPDDPAVGDHDADVEGSCGLKGPEKLGVRAGL
jgi:hypothetical protein